VRCFIRQKITGKTEKRESVLRILETLFGSDIDRISKAMTRASRRHEALVSNLANVDVPGYKRKDAPMYLPDDEAGRGVGTVRRFDPENLLRRFEPEETRDESSIRTDGNSVDLEKEIVSITETQLHYSTLSTMAKRYFQGLREVIKEGK
jgi:flagellar basal-body rod protein FlgB